VPVEREELRVEREAITGANRDQAMQGSQLSEAEHEVVLHEQRPVTRKEVVPKERVRLDTEKVKDEQKVARKLRKERIRLEEDP
jgi:stress response protein YsnF